MRADHFSFAFETDRHAGSTRTEDVGHFRKWPGHSMKRTFVGSSPELTTTSCATADVRGGSTSGASSTQHSTVCAIELVDPSIFFIRYFSKAKIRFQSFFMLMTNQPSFFAWSYSA